MDVQRKSSVEKSVLSDKAGVIDRGSGIRSIGMDIVEYGTGICLLLVLIGYFLPLNRLEKKCCIVKLIAEISKRFNSGQIVCGVWITLFLIAMTIGYFALWGAWRTTVDYVCNREYKATIYWGIYSLLSFMVFFVYACIDFPIYLLFADKGLLILLFGYFFSTIFSGISIAIKISYGNKIKRMKLFNKSE